MTTLIKNKFKSISMHSTNVPERHCKPITAPRGYLLALKTLNQESPTLQEQSYWSLEENLSAMREQATEDLALAKGTG